MTTEQTKSLGQLQALRTRHHKALEALARQCGGASRHTGLNLWRKLRRIEQQAHRAATAQCNGEAFEGEPFRDEESLELFKNGITHSVQLVLGGLPPGFFVNSDARGYALKLRPGSVELPLERDWGGNLLLAPIIE